MDLLDERCARDKIHLPLEGYLPSGRQTDRGLTEDFSRANTYPGLPVTGLEVDGHAAIGVLGRADLLNGIPVLAESLGFVRLHPGEVRLIVRVHARHQLDVRPVGIRQIALPCFGGFRDPPCEHLLSGRDVVIRHVDYARVPAVIVAPEEVVPGLRDEVGGGHRDVLTPGDVHPVGVIHSVVNVSGDGKAGHGPLGVIRHAGHVRGEHDLVLVVDVYAHIHPPQERLREGRPIVELDFELDERLLGIETDADHPLRAIYRLVVAEPNGSAPVRALLDRMTDRHKRRGAMV